MEILVGVGGCQQGEQNNSKVSTMDQGSMVFEMKSFSLLPELN